MPESKRAPDEPGKQAPWRLRSDQLSGLMLVVLAILTFVNLWKDFLLPYLVLLNAPDLQPLTVRLYFIEERSASPLSIQMAGYFMAMLPPLLIAIILQRYMQRGLSLGAVKG